MGIFRKHKGDVTERNSDVSEYIRQLKELNGRLEEKDEQINSIQEDYKKIFNLFSDMVILLDSEGTVIDLNKKAQIYFSRFYEKEHIIGTSWKKILKAHDCNWDNSIEKQMIESDVLTERSKEIYLPKFDKHFLVSVVPVRKIADDDYFILTIKNITTIKKRELSLIKKQKLLRYIDIITDIFSRNLNINYIMDKIVETLSDIENVDVVYIYKNCQCGDHSQKIRDFQKSSADIDLMDIVYYSDFPRWREYFALNQIVCGTIERFPKNERTILDRNGLKSLCVVPIYTPAGFWGFIGFDSYINKKEWTYDEEQLLKIAANIIGGEIYKWSLRNEHIETEDIKQKCINY